ncbi:hypothetical protein [Hespellia stercorisuis]|uniref:Uncharacterized protein n=1 Tax=Hespellia stercorisuis DSM 15480 TaxID=1121950 RepID=A0A1M6K5C9_9FIRM|nr:hypothetical protein [Hespellia stercorisuis]SHJ54196.1 hypothetical protein SAMN02745243_00815 [Hespellia stercorisuis DSM 15480]
MDSIVNKLSEIESAASAIVAHAEEQKAVIDDEMQKKRDEFDAKLEADTQKKIRLIRGELESRTSSLLGNQTGEAGESIEALKQEYETKHEEYAKEILARITEV